MEEAVVNATDTEEVVEETTEEVVEPTCVGDEILVNGTCAVPEPEEGGLPIDNTMILIIAGAVGAIAIAAGIAISKSKKGKGQVATRSHCGGCGAEIDPRYKFCRKCGKALPTAVTT